MIQIRRSVLFEMDIPDKGQAKLYFNCVAYFDFEYESRFTFRLEIQLARTCGSMILYGR